MRTRSLLRRDVHQCGIKFDAPGCIIIILRFSCTVVQAVSLYMRRTCGIPRAAIQLYAIALQGSSIKSSFERVHETTRAPHAEVCFSNIRSAKRLLVHGANELSSDSMERKRPQIGDLPRKVDLRPRVNDHNLAGFCRQLLHAQ